MRYLVRLTNDRAYTPKDVRALQQKIRKLFGSHERIGNLRVSTMAIEFDLFSDHTELDRSETILESEISKVISVRPIDNRASNRSADEALEEGVRLFNEERFWESHEALEEIWHPAKGVDRNIIQGLILTAAAFVHYQKNEADVCISILGRALEKLGPSNEFRDINIQQLRTEVEKILEANAPHLLRIGWI